MSLTANRSPGVRVAAAVNGPDDLPLERHLACVPGELARLELRRAPARDRDVDEEDREHGSDREGDDEAGGTGLPRHRRNCRAADAVPRTAQSDASRPLGRSVLRDGIR